MVSIVVNKIIGISLQSWWYFQDKCWELQVSWIKKKFFSGIGNILQNWLLLSLAKFFKDPKLMKLCLASPDINPVQNLALREIFMEMENNNQSFWKQYKLLLVILNPKQ